ncbi:MAG TPA: lipid II flippase MurJ, partial [Thermoanaerobaculia bacterium]|nr:lipid II flippase MurJ [Thermoanaerobaculia bacterium]
MTAREERSDPMPDISLGRLRGAGAGGSARSRKQTPERAGGGAASVASGILASRVLGFVREAALAYYFGVGAHADVFRTALRGPNILQNLLGEQTLSAAFIPIYSRLLAEGKEREAGRFAGAIFGLLLAVAGVMAGAGVLLARPLVAILSPGYLEDAAKVAAGTMTVDRFPLAVTAVKILFPMTGILVLSAWALGVLNSHRRFFLPYFAPVLWNATILAALWEGARLWHAGPGASVGALDHLLIAACFGALLGGLLQFLVQLPLVVKVMRGFRLSFSLRVAGVSEALRASLPLVLGRGVVQLTGFLDLWLASLLAAGAQGSLGWAQT